ncbi:hypothetical protein [Alterisphingorhabdus coralli]|uniref:Cysteine rich repeat-containing protein n=1 Tax=Alterisphingorhabdus coralli TaxID=3071408 RepID=A0AA97FBQ1_9SPHN|nr:hypothetical protein [Parasphingorhabdus sp. SCSIO 66989]WOE76120.1 hypothetical protein RB602_05235 [Parasphingorhabdus sp. SCSIO 66989]
MNPLPQISKALAVMLALTTVNAHAMQNNGGGQGITKNCRGEIMKMCRGSGRDGVRACIQENFEDLSVDCQNELLARMEQQQQREDQD